METKNNEKFNPTAVFTAAEKLYKFQKEKIESVFECKVFDSYGSNEIRSMAYECEEHNGYHITAENVIIEFIKEGEQASPGELGEIIITDLTNYAMPLIRYRIGDIGIPSDQRCTCGRGLPLMESVEGRSNSFVATKDNRILSSSYFSELLMEFKYIKQFQIIQKSLNSLHINLVCSEEPTYSEVNHLINSIKNSTKDDMEIKVKQIKTISPAKSGKLQLVISEIPLKMDV
jgi:phenylacetate-CoA ligase